jgi:hypothetical protein
LKNDLIDQFLNGNNKHGLWSQPDPLGMQDKVILAGRRPWRRGGCGQHRSLLAGPLQRLDWLEWIRKSTFPNRFRARHTAALAVVRPLVQLVGGLFGDRPESRRHWRGERDCGMRRRAIPCDGQRRLTMSLCPRQRRTAETAAGPSRADNRLMRCSKPHLLFDHLVGAGEQRRGHFQAERLGGVEIDQQLEFYGLQDW